MDIERRPYKLKMVASGRKLNQKAENDYFFLNLTYSIYFKNFVNFYS